MLASDPRDGQVKVIQAAAALAAGAIATVVHGGNLRPRRPGDARARHGTVLLARLDELLQRLVYGGKQ
jgi:hypothetical protein